LAGKSREQAFNKNQKNSNRETGPENAFHLMGKVNLKNIMTVATSTACRGHFPGAAA